MIDFSCCEVKQAIKTLYSDNEVLSIQPIIKSKNQSFENNRNTVYYGAFANPSEAMNLTYKGDAVVNSNVDILFNHVDGFLYDAFSGYKITLKNSFVPIDTRIVKIYLDDTNLNGWSVDVQANGVNLGVGANEYAYGSIDGLNVVSIPEEVKISLDGGGANKVQSLQLSEADILFDYEVEEYYITIFMYGVS